MIDTEHLIGLMRSLWSYLKYDFEHEQYFEIVKRLRGRDKLLSLKHNYKKEVKRR